MKLDVFPCFRNSAGSVGTGHNGLPLARGQVNLINISQQPVTTIVVDYPGATFGKNQLDPGKTYLYPVKPLETGPLKIQFADANGKMHTALGPELHKNDDGLVEVRFDQEKAVAKLQT